MGLAHPLPPRTSQKSVIFRWWIDRDVGPGLGRFVPVGCEGYIFGTWRSLVVVVVDNVGCGVTTFAVDESTYRSMNLCFRVPLQVWRLHSKSLDLV